MTIAVDYAGTTCLFSDRKVDPDRPGWIYQHLLQGRFYEQQFLSYIRSLELPGRYIDVGAYIGTHTVFFAALCRADHVYSFEPRLRFFEELQANVALNGLEGRVTTVNCGLSDRATSATVRLDRVQETFPVRRLDNLVEERVALVKIDVEGMEPRVLDGAARILRESGPRIFAEAGTHAEYERVTACLERHHYSPTGRVWNATPTYEFVPTLRERRWWFGGVTALARVRAQLVARPSRPQ